MRSNSASFSRVSERSSGSPERRLRILWIGILVGGALLAARFFQLQVLEHDAYALLASDQHGLQSSLVPRRGTLYTRDPIDKSLHPIVKDRDAWQVFVVPKEIKDREGTAKTLVETLALDANEWMPRLTSPTATYMVVGKDVPWDTIQKVKEKKLLGVGVSQTTIRSYPEKGMGGQWLGFVTLNDQNEREGRYGLESYFQKELAGTYGKLIAERDAAGRRLALGTTELTEARHGSDLVLTIDRTIQYEACKTIEAGVKQYEADSGTVIIMDPTTGAVLGICSYPDFDPERVREIKEVNVLNNPAVFYRYEPGSVFKAVTYAAGLDKNLINPHTTYTDMGEEHIDNFTIRNSDKQAHGVQTMTQALAESLNTATIFVERLLGKDAFRDAVKRFGFGEKTGITFPTEQKGDIQALEKQGDIFYATASFGQGIAVTPLQMLAAYNALGNGGYLMKPYIVQEIIHNDGTRDQVKPQLIRRVIGDRASQLISAMLVNVVERGHGKRAGVPGYYVAGKTGTAQIADPNGGYLKDATIGSFAGYAPAERPKFSMIVKLDRPRTVQFAESSAAPLFGKLAKFLLNYLQVPPERPVKRPPPEPAVPALPTPVVTSTTRGL